MVWSRGFGGALGGGAALPGQYKVGLPGGGRRGMGAMPEGMSHMLAGGGLHAGVAADFGGGGGGGGGVTPLGGGLGGGAHFGGGLGGGGGGSI